MPILLLICYSYNSGLVDLVIQASFPNVDLQSCLVTDEEDKLDTPIDTSYIGTSNYPISHNA